MLNNDTIVKVTNRDNGSVGYYVQDMNIRRDFMPNETKEVTMEELRKLSFQAGGPALLKMCLVIDNHEAIQELLGEVEPEYFYSEEDIKNLLLNGTIEQFMDCLDFAPSGVIDLIKDLSVKLEISDINKRNAILSKTGFNVTKAIEINKESETDQNNEDNKVRRATPIVGTNEGFTKQASDNEGFARRASVPKYNVVTKK